VGELLARMELFLFTAAIIQHFDVVPPDGVDISRDKYVTVGNSRLPLDNKLIYRPRT
jgi:hypothetical protein